MSVVLYCLVAILSIYFAVKQCFRKRVFLGLLNILLTIATLVIDFLFYINRRWAQIPPQSEWNYLVQELGAFNLMAYFVLSLYIVIIALIVYNAKQVINGKKRVS